MSGPKKGIKGAVVECPADGEVCSATRSIHFVRRSAKLAGEDLRVVGPRPREVCIAASGQRSLDRVIESGIAGFEIGEPARVLGAVAEHNRLVEILCGCELNGTYERGARQKNLLELHESPQARTAGRATDGFYS